MYKGYPCPTDILYLSLMVVDGSNGGSDGDYGGSGVDAGRLLTEIDRLYRVELP